MTGPPDGWPDHLPYHPMTRDWFVQTLVGIRNAANIEFVRAEDADAVDEKRAIWHAAEVALGMVHPGYVPSHEALIEVHELLASRDYEEDDDE